MTNTVDRDELVDAVAQAILDVELTARGLPHSSVASVVGEDKYRDEARAAIAVVRAREVAPLRVAMTAPVNGLVAMIRMSTDGAGYDVGNGNVRELLAAYDALVAERDRLRDGIRAALDGYAATKGNEAAFLEAIETLARPGEPEAPQAGEAK